VENQDSLKSAFLFYEKYVKPVIVSLQAEYEHIPMEFLLEIYSAFDHLKRSALDCFKMLINKFCILPL